jgi:hypothetical protein
MALLSSDQNPVSGYSHPLSEEARAALEKEKEENEENEVGFDPLQAAALSAGASLLRNSGWRNTPMSLGEGIGHAIPAGMQAYYNQDAMNRQEEQGLYERQLAEQEAQAAQQAEDDKALADEKYKRAITLEFKATLAGSRLRPEQKEIYMQMFQDNPEKGMAALEKELSKKKDSKTGPVNTYRKIEELERERKGLPEDVYEEVTPKDGDVRFYIDKMGTKLAMPVEDEEEGKTTIGFVDDPKSANLIVTENGAYKTSVPRVKEGEVVTEDVVTETYDAVLELDSSLEGQEKANAILLSGGTPEERHTALFEMIKEFKAPAKPEGEIDWTAAASNIYDKFSGAKNPDGAPKYNEEKLQAALSHPDPEQRYKNLETFMNSVDSQAYKEFVAVGGLKLREASLEQTKGQYTNEQKKYIKREQVRLADEARKMNWGESRSMMAEQSHDRKIRQMDKNWEDGQKKNLVTAKEWITENGGKLPEGVSFVERRPDGKMGKLINNDWTTYTAPLNTGAKTEVSDEINRLFTKYGDKFGETDKDEISGLLWSKDPMDALRKAHAYLQEKGQKGIAPPASILKKYMSDVGVAESAKKALELLESDESVQAGTGWVWGRITEKFKSADFQRFKSLSTSASLAKRHELIGSQMTDGELKFTESMFPSNGDTLESAKIKLQNLLRDSKFNLNLIHSMFSAEAGYNDAVWSEKVEKMDLTQMNE